jgi:DNA-3-methyladenine glycosylase I
MVNAAEAWYEGFFFRMCFLTARAVSQTDKDVERLMLPEAGIIRHRGKINSAINNAQRVKLLQQEHGSFAKYLWSFMPNGRPINNTWRCAAACSAELHIQYHL